jgi:hypothetical protein
MDFMSTPGWLLPPPGVKSVLREQPRGPGEENGVSFLFVSLGFELRASYLLDRRSYCLSHFASMKWGFLLGGKRALAVL